MYTRFPPALLLVLAGACAAPPIEWDEPRALPTGDAGARLAIASDGAVLVRGDSAVVPPPAPSRCEASIRVAYDTTAGFYAAWWSVLEDSTAELVVARSPDGRTWHPPVRVDTLDAGRTGCRRPAPAIDAYGGHVHLAYAMAAREGPGIFASHSMDRGVMFHTPVAVVYGERIGEAAIAARGNHVAIAFEDPNSARDQIGLVYSSTMAHLFQHRETVSPSGGPARRPRVAIGDGRIVVAWTRPSASDTTHVARTGRIR